MKEILGIQPEILALAKETEKEVRPVFEQIEEICEINSSKVLEAFQENNIAEMHFGSTTRIWIQ